MWREAADVEGAAEAYPGTIVLLSEPGLPRQRNAVIEAAVEADIVVFFDDDFLPDPGYLAAIEQHMARDPHIVVATGLLLADGINGPGLSPAGGRAILSRHAAAPGARSPDVQPTFSGYGCNMAVRLAPMRAHGLRFDERLPLYGWQEDVDLSRRLAAFGQVVRIDAACGVHLGVKSGRGSGVRLGYSQVANPLYLCGKRRGYPLPAGHRAYREEHGDEHRARDLAGALRGPARTAVRQPARPARPDGPSNGPGAHPRPVGRVRRRLSTPCSCE